MTIHLLLIYYFFSAFEQLKKMVTKAQSSERAPGMGSTAHWRQLGGTAMTTARGYGENQSHPPRLTTTRGYPDDDSSGVRGYQSHLHAADEPRADAIAPHKNGTPEQGASRAPMTSSGTSWRQTITSLFFSNFIGGHLGFEVAAWINWNTICYFAPQNSWKQIFCNINDPKRAHARQTTEVSA